MEVYVIEFMSSEEPGEFSFMGVYDSIELAKEEARKFLEELKGYGYAVTFGDLSEDFASGDDMLVVTVENDARGEDAHVAITRTTLNKNLCK